MLKLVDKPDNNIAWTGAPSLLLFVKSGVQTTEGEFASLTLVFLKATPPTGGALPVRWQTNTIIFIMDANPDPLDPQYIQAWATGMVWGDYMKLIASQIEAHPLIGDFYTVKATYSDATYGVVKLTAKKKGPAFNIIVLSGSLSVTLDASTVSISGVDPVMLENYQLSLSPTIKTNRLHEELTIEPKSISGSGILSDATNQLEVEFHDLKDLSKNVTAPTLPHLAYAPFIAHKLLAHCHVKLREYYADVASRNLSSENGTINGLSKLIFLHGGIDLPKYSNAPTAEYTTGSPVKFLTAQPREKIVFTDQPEWLSLYCVPDEYIIRYKLYFSDATSAFQSVTVNVPYFENVLCIPTGYEQAGIALHTPAKTVTHYEVYVDNNSGQYSERFTYVVDRAYEMYKQYFLVLNSVGGYDTLCCIAGAKFTGKFTRQTNAYALNKDTRTDTGTLQMVVNEEQSMLTVRTGYLEDPTLVENFRQLLLSTAIYKIPELVPNDRDIPFKQHFISMVVVQDSVEYLDDKDPRWGLEFQMQVASNAMHFSDKVIPKENFYDTFVEFTAKTTADTEIQFQLTTAESSKIYANGELVAENLTTFTHSITGTNEIHYRIEAYGLTTFYAENNNSEAEICVTRIASDTLAQFRMLSFKAFTGTYLLNRIDSLYLLTHLFLDCTASTFPVDAYLERCKLLKDSTYCSLSELQLTSGATLGTFGTLYENALISAGITVTT